MHTHKICIAFQRAAVTARVGAAGVRGGARDGGRKKFLL